MPARGEGGGNSQIKGQGHLLEILKRTPKRYLDPVFGVWFEIFHP